MTRTDPMSNSDLNALARLSKTGVTLHKNQQFELDQAVKYDTADVKDILEGKK